MGSRLISRCFLLVAGLSACADHSPARIQFMQDTTTINTRLASDVGMRVRDKRGRDVEKARVGYAVAPDSLLWVMQNGKFGCLKNGVGTVTVSTGNISGTTHVQCDLIASLGPKWAFNVVRLIIGEPGVPLPADPRGENGEPMLRARFPVSVADSSVVQLKDGMLHGLKLGSTFVRLSAGGRADMAVFAEVHERIFNAKDITIGGGDFFMERLVPGEYQLDTRFDRSGVVTVWTGTRCPAALPTAEVHDMCSVGAGAALVLRNTSAVPIRGHISLMRTTATRPRVARL